MINALTIDVEDWYQTNDFDIPPEKWDGFEDRIVGSTDRVLDILACNRARATFFILGSVAKKHPGLIKQIAAGGHEIASHGTWHRMVFRQTPQEFRADLVYTKEILEDLCGKAVRYYRAPSWSISRKSLWALEILEEEGYILDSSLQPYWTPLSGIAGAPNRPYYPLINGRRLNLLEYPPSSLLFWKIPFAFAGGLYLRILPSLLIVSSLRKVNKKGPGLVYTHPWEHDPFQPRLKVSPLIRFVHYYNLSKTSEKLSILLNQFTFKPIGEVIGNYQYPSLPV